MITEVSCYAGYAYPERPRYFIVGDHRFEVKEIITEWAQPGRKSFRVITNHGYTYELHYHYHEEIWQVDRI